MASIGDRFGRYVIIHSAPSGERNRTRWICRCDCGEIRNIGDICFSRKRSPTRSCGCLQREAARASKLKHGFARKIPEYGIWLQIKQRCNNPRFKQFSDYGGRGIKLCPSWNESFSDFLADMGRRPTANHTIERHRLNDGYSPDNCSWQTRDIQSRNTRSNVWVTVNGKTLCCEDWPAAGSPVRAALIRYRIHAGWSHEDAVLIPASSRSHKPREVK